MVTIKAGSSRAKASRRNHAAAPSFKLVTINGAGAKPRSDKAAHNASIGAVSAASSMAR